MQPDLADVLTRHTSIAEESTVWGKGGPTPTPLHITGYFAAESPPLTYVTSVRALVLRGDELLTLHTVAETQILPGGRREGGESPETTLRREVLDESGWTIDNPSLVGFIHFRHLGPRPSSPADDRYHYSYPDFINLVYVAEAESYNATSLLPNEYEQVPYTLRPIAEVLTLPLTPIARAYLDAFLVGPDSLYISSPI